MDSSAFSRLAFLVHPRSIQVVRAVGVGLTRGPPAAPPLAIILPAPPHSFLHFDPLIWLRLALHLFRSFVQFQDDPVNHIYSQVFLLLEGASRHGDACWEEPATSPGNTHEASLHEELLHLNEMVIRKIHVNQRKEPAATPISELKWGTAWFG